MPADMLTSVRTAWRRRDCGVFAHRWTRCVAAVVLVMGCATGPKRDLPQVHSVRIEGARKVKEGDIKKHILTTENSWVPFSRRQYFEDDAWKTDLRRIEKFYRAQGFYQAKVTAAEVKPHGKEVDVLATVEEGDPTRISSVNVQGLDDLPEGDRKQLLEQVELKVGQIFIVERWDGLKEQLLHTLLEEGYAAATAQGEVKVGLDTHAAEVTVSIDHGPRYRFGALSVKEYTPSRVSPWRITEQAAAEATPGDWYSLKAQSEAEARVFKMGVFGAVKLKPGDPDPGTLTVPLQVDAQESRFHTLSVGGGIAVDQTRQEVRATSSYIDRDFMGGLRRLTLGAMAGYAWIPTFYASTASGAQRGVVGSLSGELEQPRLLSFRDLKLDTKLTLERGIEPAYSYYGGRAKLAVVYTPTNHLTITPSYNLEFYRLESGSAQLTGPAPALLFGCPDNCVLSYAEQLVEWDMRDDRQEPHRGSYLALSLQEGGGILGGSFGYFRIVPEVRGYVSFLEADKLTFAARLKVGTLIPANGNDASSPIVSRFYSGGNNMRGFNSRRLSPEFVVPQPGSTTLGYTVPVGGDGLFELSFEARYNLTGAVVLATFVDTGFVTRERFHARNFRDMLVAFGAGVRYRTPVGPIRVDFGYRPDIGPPLPVIQSPGTTLTYPTRSSCFGLGGGGPTAGAPEGPCVLHISIGEAF